MKTFVRSLFAAAASALCLNFGGCAVAITKDGVYVAIGNNAASFHADTDQSDTPTTPEPELTEEQRYQRMRDEDPLYQEGLRAMRDIADHHILKYHNYDHLKKALKDLTVITQNHLYFADALMASGLMAKFDPEQAVEDQFSNAIQDTVGKFLEHEMAATLIALADDSDTASARALCKGDQRLAANLRKDFGISTADLLEPRIASPLRTDYINACRTYMGRNNLLVYEQT